jgi:hypothetical protein
MKKKIGMGILATMLVAVAFVFANSATQNNSSSCPECQDCICPKAATEQVAQVEATEASAACDIDPDCICK